MSLYNKFSNNSYEILLEMYAGKPKELLECEKLLDKIIVQIKKDSDNMLDFKRERHITSDYSVNKELCNKLRDFFNVGNVIIYWFSGEANAYTLLHSSFTTIENKYNHLRGDKSPILIQICIYEDLVTRCDLTAQELMAVILHEIGHNFYFCPIALYGEIIRLIVTFPIGMVVNFIMKFAYKMSFITTDIIKQYFPALYNAIDLYHYAANTIIDYIKPIQVVLYMGSAINRFVTSPNFNLSGYGDEKGADSFAAKYGYGPEQASVLRKLDTPMNSHYYKTMSKKGENTGASIIEDLCSLTIDLIAGMTLDPHPNNNQRASAMLKKLERDLETGDYPPEMKRSLESEIVRMRKAYEVINDSKFGGDIEIRKGWYKIIDTATNGYSDLREIFNFYFNSFSF